MKNFNINFLIDECKTRKVQPKNIFEQPYDGVVDAQKFFDLITKNTSNTYKNNSFKRIESNNSDSEFYQVLYNYLDRPYTNSNNYHKLQPALINQNNEPVDGRHRAALCILLGIKLPVKKIIEESLNEDFQYPTGKIIGDDVFDTSYQEIPNYNRFIKTPEIGNKVMTIMQFTPREYFNACAEIFNSNIYSQLRQIEADKDILNTLYKVIDSGKQFPLTILDYTTGTQEGRHRMYVVGERYGWNKKFPVGVITYIDKELADREKKQEEEDKIYKNIERAVNRTLEFQFTDIDEFKDQLYWDVRKVFGEEKQIELSENDNQYIIEIDNVEYPIDKTEIDFIEKIEEPDIDDDTGWDKISWEDVDWEEEDFNENLLKESYKVNLKLIGYHGSDQDIDNFNLDNFGKHDAGMWGKGVYFTNNKEVAQKLYSQDKYIYKCQLNIKNPLTIKDINDVDNYLALGEDNNQVTEILKERGYDGVISKDEEFYIQNEGKFVKADQYIVFYTQDIDVLEKEILNG